MKTWPKIYFIWLNKIMWIGFSESWFPCYEISNLTKLVGPTVRRQLCNFSSLSFEPNLETKIKYNVQKLRKAFKMTSKTINYCNSLCNLEIFLVQTFQNPNFDPNFGKNLKIRVYISQLDFLLSAIASKCKLVSKLPIVKLKI